MVVPAPQQQPAVIELSSDEEGDDEQDDDAAAAAAAGSTSSRKRKLSDAAEGPRPAKKKAPLSEVHKSHIIDYSSANARRSHRIERLRLVQDANKARDQLGQELSKARQRLASCERTNMSLWKKLEAMDLLRSAAEDKNMNYRKSETKLNKQMDTLKRKLSATKKNPTSADSTAATTALEQHLKDAKTEVTQVKKKMAASLKKKDTAIATAREESHRVKAENNELKKQVSAAAKELTGVHKSVAALEKSAASSSSDSGAALKGAEKEIVQLKSAVASAEQIAAQQVEHVKRVKKVHKEVVDAVGRHGEENHQLQQELAGVRKNMLALRAGAQAKVQVFTDQLKAALKKSSENDKLILSSEQKTKKLESTVIQLTKQANEKEKGQTEEMKQAK